MIIADTVAASQSLDGGGSAAVIVIAHGHMIDIAVPCKEDQIAGSRIGYGDLDAARIVGLILGDSGKTDAQAPVKGLDKAGAVRATSEGIDPAPDIGMAQALSGQVDQGLSLSGGLIPVLYGKGGMEKDAVVQRIHQLFGLCEFSSLFCPVRSRFSGHQQGFLYESADISAFRKYISVIFPGKDIADAVLFQASDGPCAVSAFQDLQILCRKSIFLFCQVTSRGLGEGQGPVLLRQDA